jgi:hypothetical protein
MRKVLQFPLLCLVFVASAHAEADPNSEDKPADAMSAESVPVVQPSENKWYAGGGFGFDRLKGWNPNAVDGYYQARGYSKFTQENWLWSEQQSFALKWGFELNAYIGRKLNHSFDIETGISGNVVHWETWSEYQNSAGTREKISQNITFAALYLAALYRPLKSKFGNGLYFKLGGHASQLDSMTKIDGTPVDPNTLGAGSNIPRNGISRGYGSLIGLGFDMKLPKAGSIRLEVSRFNNLGGTHFVKDAVGISFNTSF